MNCAQFREHMQDVARDAADPVALTNALAHADSCAPCDALLERAELLTASLRGLAQRHASAEAPPRTQKLLLAAFRRNAMESRRADSRAKNQRFFALAGIMGVAAAVFLVIFLVRNAEHSAPVERSQPRIAAPANAPARGNAAPNPRDVLLASSSTDQEDTTTEFVPLSESFDPSSVDDATVVRVILSPSALASLGFPVADDRGTDDVAADLLLAQDGTPQAIRLLNSGNTDQAMAVLSELH